MATHPNRRDFLRGSVSRAADPFLRPPGNTGTDFTEKCTGCSACLTACPEGILAQDGDGKAFIDLRAGECTFCGSCADACDTGALMPELVADWPWRAEIGPTCLSRVGVTCRSCQDACDPRAIRFQLQSGGRASPVLDTDSCTGCGACAAVCPVNALNFKRKGPIAEEATV